MRWIPVALLVVAFPYNALAQSATITSPVAEAKLVVETMLVDRSEGGWVKVSVQTSGNQVKRYLRFDINPGAETLSFFQGIDTAVAGEQSGARRYNFRILNWLNVNNKLRDDDGSAIAVTLVP